jgi:hypothetical protein
LDVGCASRVKGDEFVCAAEESEVVARKSESCEVD